MEMTVTLKGNMISLQISVGSFGRAQLSQLVAVFSLIGFVPTFLAICIEEFCQVPNYYESHPTHLKIIVLIFISNSWFFLLSRLFQYEVCTGGISLSCETVTLRCETDLATQNQLLGSMTILHALPLNRAVKASSYLDIGNLWEIILLTSILPSATKFSISPQVW